MVLFFYPLCFFGCFFQAATGCTAVSARQDPELPNDVLVVLQGPFQAVHAAVAAVLAAV